jgi:hypothetical protein
MRAFPQAESLSTIRWYACVMPHPLPGDRVASK